MPREGIRDVQDMEDIFLWPDGEWCYRYEVGEYTHRSDDYEEVRVHTLRWYDLVE